MTKKRLKQIASLLGDKLCQLSDKIDALKKLSDAYIAELEILEKEINKVEEIPIESGWYKVKREDGEERMIAVSMDVQTEELYWNFVGGSTLHPMSELDLSKITKMR